MAESTRIALAPATPEEQTVRLRVDRAGPSVRNGESLGVAEFTQETKISPDDYRSRIAELEAEIAAVRARCTCGA